MRLQGRRALRIEIHAPRSARAHEECTLRAVLFNDGYEPVAVSRNAFVGPNVRAPHATGHPLPESVEPTFGGPDEPLTLQPFSFYGRERSYSLPPGEAEIVAYYRSSDGGEELAASEVISVDTASEEP
jgi:hypothetical protein